MALGGNFLRAAPDTDATAEALRRMRLTVHVSTKLNRSHLVTGDQALILPALAPERGRRAGLGRAGRLGRGLDEHGPPVARAAEARVMRSCARRSRSSAASRAASSTASRRSRGRSSRRDYSRVRAKIARRRARLRAVRGAARPTASCCRTRRAMSAASRRPPGRARLSVNELDAIQLAEGRLLLQTMRSHDQYNTTIYGLNDRYRGVKGGRRVVLVHPDDLAERGLQRRRPRRPRRRVGGRRAPGRAVPCDELPDRARVRGRVLPGGERARPAGQHRGGQQHADLEVDRDPAGAERGMNRHHAMVERDGVA